MLLTPVQTIIMILAVAAATQITRWLPFVLFPENREVPATVDYLGRVLPPAMVGLLVIFSFKSVSFAEFPFGLPELLASAVVVLLQYKKGNTLLSIAVGTLLYMVIIRLV